jgi:hypothetical protein
MIVFRTKMAYDTGCGNLDIFVDELHSLVAPNAILPTTTVTLASGTIRAKKLLLKVRVMADNNHILRDWQFQTACVLPRNRPSASRLSSRSLLNGTFFIFERPSDRLLCVGRYKTGAYNLL